MRTLKIENGGKLIIDGEIADINLVKNKEEFISSLLMLDVELSEEMNVSDIIHFFYDAKKIIKSLFLEEYEVVRALATTSVLSKEHKNLRIYKSFKIEKEIFEGGQEFMYMIPEIDIEVSEPGETGVMTVAGLPVKIDENISLVHGNTVINSKTKITLLDLMTCLFDELPALLKDSGSLS